jgi:hypothetical protein
MKRGLELLAPQPPENVVFGQSEHHAALAEA